jgi:hypothetical protein
MPLNLDEIKSLIGALGVKIPEDILVQKAKAEEFAARREKIAAEAGGKPADWWLKGRFDDALKGADDSASQKQFDSALKLLDEAGQLLQQPNEPPPVTTPEAEGSAGVPKVKAATGVKVLFQQSQLAWETTRAKVQAELRRMEETILAAAADEPDLAAIATKVKDIYGILGGLDTNLRDKLDEGYVAQTPEEKVQRHDEARALIQQTTNFVNGDPLMAVIDNNPFGAYDVKGCVTAALKDLAGKFA